VEHILGSGAGSRLAEIDEGELALGISHECEAAPAETSQVGHCEGKVSKGGSTEQSSEHASGLMRRTRYAQTELGCDSLDASEKVSDGALSITNRFFLN